MRMKDCPSYRAFIAIEDGGYVSVSDVEDDLALVANHVADMEIEEEDCYCGLQIYSCVEYIEYTT